MLQRLLLEPGLQRGTRGELGVKVSHRDDKSLRLAHERSCDTICVSTPFGLISLSGFVHAITPVPFGISGTGVFFYARALGDFFHLVSNAAHERGEALGSARVSIIDDVSKAACGR